VYHHKYCFEINSHDSKQFVASISFTKQTDMGSGNLQLSDKIMILNVNKIVKLEVVVCHILQILTSFEVRKKGTNKIRSL
jgi:hypothetical protein